MAGAPQPEEQRPRRWDTYPLGYANPRWDAGVRHWPGGVLLVALLALFIALEILLGLITGPLVTGLVVAIYPVVLILLPLRRRLVPREIAVATSPVRMRVWVLGWLFVAAGTACLALAYSWSLSGHGLVGALAYVACDLPVVMGVIFIMRAPAWELWMSRGTRKRNRPSSLTDGDAT